MTQRDFHSLTVETSCCDKIKNMFKDTNTSLLLNSSGDFSDFALSVFRISINAAAVFFHKSAVVFLFQEKPWKELESKYCENFKFKLAPPIIKLLTCFNGKFMSQR